MGRQCWELDRTYKQVGGMELGMNIGHFLLVGGKVIIVTTAGSGNVPMRLKQLQLTSLS